MKLKEYGEIVGRLYEVDEEKENVVLTFAIEKRIEIPNGTIKNQNIKELIGARIGVLNADGKYHIRRIKN